MYIASDYEISFAHCGKGIFLYEEIHSELLLNR